MLPEGEGMLDCGLAVDSTPKPPCRKLVIARTICVASAKATATVRHQTADISPTDHTMSSNICRSAQISVSYRSRQTDRTGRQKKEKKQREEGKEAPRSRSR